MKRLGKALVALIVLGGLLVFATHNSSGNGSIKDSHAPAQAKTQSQNKPQKIPEAEVQAKKVEIKETKETQAVPFQSITQKDPSLESGQSTIITQGVNGMKIITYKITYTDSVETSKQKTSEIITTQPITQVTKIGTYITPKPPSPSGPAGATALCVDGWISYAEHHQGACSEHGGVNIWYR
jgi:hypothetical protein